MGPPNVGGGWLRNWPRAATCGCLSLLLPTGDAGAQGPLAGRPLLAAHTFRACREIPPPPLGALKLSIHPPSSKEPSGDHRIGSQISRPKKAHQFFRTGGHPSPLIIPVYPSTSTPCLCFLWCGAPFGSHPLRGPTAPSPPPPGPARVSAGGRGLAPGGAPGAPAPRGERRRGPQLPRHPRRAGAPRHVWGLGGG